MFHEDSLSCPRSSTAPSPAVVPWLGKALVVDSDEKTRVAANYLLLNSAGLPFDYATSLVEATEFLRHNNYVCIFAASELPAIAGATPRRQDLENLLEKIDRLKGTLKPPRLPQEP